MELGIKAREIMNENFPIFDSSLDLESCIRDMNKQEACVVLHNGFFYSILSYNDLLKAIFKKTRKNFKLKDTKSDKNFAVVKPDTDIFVIIKLMTNEKIDFVIVKDKNFIGLITKKEVAEMNQLLFDKLEKEMIKEM